MKSGSEILLPYVARTIMDGIQLLSKMFFTDDCVVRNIFDVNLTGLSFFEQTLVMLVA